jgi:hypothetical protein
VSLNLFIKVLLTFYSTLVTTKIKHELPLFSAMTLVNSFRSLRTRCLWSCVHLSNRAVNLAILALRSSKAKFTCPNVAVAAEETSVMTGNGQPLSDEPCCNSVCLRSPIDRDISIWAQI